MAEIIAHKYVKTRKPHNCFGCAREFPKGSILNREAVAECQKCKEEFVVCGMEELKIYNGCRIRSSTVRKIEKMWNKQATRTPQERGGEK